MHHSVSGETEIHDNGHDQDRRAEDGHEDNRDDRNCHPFTKIAHTAKIDIVVVFAIDHDPATCMMFPELLFQPLVNSVRQVPGGRGSRGNGRGRCW